MYWPRNRISMLTVVVALAVGSAVVYKGCGGSAPEQWQSSAEADPVDLMAGTWRGTWASDDKPLKGELTAAIVRRPDGTYRASFDATTPLGGSNKSVCIFRVTEGPDAWEFEGSEDLGLLRGGTYRYEGTVDGEEFVCTYDSAFDRGVFRMTRVSEQ
jgi:hypothetical protein